MTKLTNQSNPATDTDNGLKLSEREELELLRKEKAERVRKENGEPVLKVSQKGAVSMYGFGRFPVTLYKSQWERLIKHIGLVEQFLSEHNSELAVKA